ncbi:mitochondrial outer membrane protein IML2 [Coprinellus micaceus]|uniref:Mitochondrial outer membrane protein IML2 n=1 Tax=Coprinellus micaceus TaxID=71717 RepID=A0A4Y7SJS9_COPMI|nr:mitochondrial outer membrane protein IML2 [Coprinellus micaceus]
MAANTHPHPHAALLESATEAFGHLFANDIRASKEQFGGKEDPFHLMGLGVCVFLEAVLGMEANVVTEASKQLALADTASKKWAKDALAGRTKGKDYYSRFPAGMEWEIINADAIVLLGLTNALSESYMGYLQCMYALNNAHSKFTKLYKTVFPAGIPSSPSSPSSPTLALPPPSSATLTVPSIKHKASISSLASVSSSNAAGKGFFSRWVAGGNAAAAASEPNLLAGHGGKGHKGHLHESQGYQDGPVEELVVSGVAFGYGLFNLVFSLLPKKVQGLVGFLGFQHDRPLALKALALSASKSDVHSVFSGLVLMTYHGVVLLLGGWQADVRGRVEEYEGVVARVEKRYPDGALWILNRAKILRMTLDPEGAIRVLKEGLREGRERSFKQADMMLWFELAWTLLQERKFEEAAEAFVKMTELNSWSHGTYYFLASGCHFSLGDKEKAQQLLDTIPSLIDAKKMGGKDLPTEVFIKKKLAFYQEKQKRRGGDPAKFVEAIRISPAEELAIFWNTASHITIATARAHIKDFANLTPKLTITSPAIEELAPFNVDREKAGKRSATLTRSDTVTSKSTLTPTASTSEEYLVEEEGTDLDNADELAVRALLLGVLHRRLDMYEEAGEFLREAVAWCEGTSARVKVNTWVGGVACFERAVNVLRGVEWREKQAQSAGGVEKEGGKDKEGKSKEGWKEEWEKAMKKAGALLDRAMALSPNSVDLSSRLDSRVSMLRDEMATKREALGVGHY